MCVNTPEIPDREMVSMRRKDRQFGEVSEKTRKNMQKIRSKDTSIEVALRKRLWHDGYRYRKDLKDAGFTDDDIAGMMDCKPGEVRTMLSALRLMDEYLDEYGYSGMYTQLDKSEDSFLKLDSALKKYKAGVASMWAYDPEADVADLKLIAFDYIRANFEQTLFRDIISVPSAKKPASSFFAKQEVWEQFRDQHFATTDSVQEESVEDVMAKNPPDLGRALKARDQQWKQKVEESFDDNYIQSMCGSRTRPCPWW